MLFVGGNRKCLAAKLSFWRILSTVAISLGETPFCCRRDRSLESLKNILSFRLYKIGVLRGGMGIQINTSLGADEIQLGKGRGLC